MAPTIEDVPQPHRKYIVSLFEKRYGENIKHDAPLTWVKHDIDWIVDLLNSMENEKTSNKYTDAVNHVVEMLKPKRKTRAKNGEAMSATERSRKYRTERKAVDPEWHLYSLARAYIDKLRMTGQPGANANNSLPNGPSDKMIEKYKLYEREGIWYSKSMKEYSKKYKYHETRKCRVYTWGAGGGKLVDIPYFL